MFITYKNVVLLAKTVVKTVRTFPARIYRIFVLSDFWCSFIFCLGWKPVKGFVLLPPPPLPRFYDLFYMRPNPGRFFFYFKILFGKVSTRGERVKKSTRSKTYQFFLENRILRKCLKLGNSEKA